MSKFRREGGEKADNSDKSGKKQTGRSAYKAKRSFTRNKSYRERDKEDRESPDRRDRRTSSGKYDNKREEKFGTPARKGSDKKGRGPGAGTKTGSFTKERDRVQRSSRSHSFDNEEKRVYPKKERFSSRGKRRDEEDAPRRVREKEFEEGRGFSRREEGREKRKKYDGGLIRLNKYLSNAGIASRREADALIESGAVKVNGEVVNQLGYKIKPGDKVTYGGEAVRGERKVYLLLNKPKDYITTMDDPRDRKTVMSLIEGACRERVFPVGRLDRNTTGLLLFTNDGELAAKLTHPKYNVKKVYHVTLDKNLKTDHFKALIEGIELEDGLAKADDLAFVGEGKRDIGIEIHSGRNRIVRRMFEHLGYQVVKLDRVVFAGLTKKDLPRGRHRFLTQREVSFLKMIG